MSDTNEDIWDSNSQDEDTDNNWELNLSTKHLEQLNQKFYKLGIREGILNQKLNYNDLGSKQGYKEGVEYGRKFGSLAGTLSILNKLLVDKEEVLTNTLTKVQSLQVDDFLDKTHFTIYPNKLNLNIENEVEDEEKIDLKLNFENLEFASHLHLDKEMRIEGESKVDRLYNEFLDKVRDDLKDV